MREHGSSGFLFFFLGCLGKPVAKGIEWIHSLQAFRVGVG